MMANLINKTKKISWNFINKFTNFQIDTNDKNNIKS